jgi:F-type H+-transporting ATPase subunit b
MDNPLVQPDPGLFIWTIFTFLVLLLLLQRFAWKPLLQALENRQEMIRQSLEDAKLAKQELERVQQDSLRIVSEARVEADTIILNSRSDAAKIRDQLREQARNETDVLLKNAEKEIQQETAQALSQIRHEAVDISLTIASKLIQRNLSKEDNEALIENALKQIRPTQS